jgi:hypothetical protein
LIADSATNAANAVLATNAQGLVGLTATVDALNFVDIDQSLNAKFDSVALARNVYDAKVISDWPVDSAAGETLVGTYDSALDYLAKYKITANDLTAVNTIYTADSTTWGPAYPLYVDSALDLLATDVYGGGSYTADSAGLWSAPTPTTVDSAIDRLALLVKTLNGGIGA